MSGSQAAPEKEKAALRRVLRRRRTQMPAGEQAAASRTIARLLLEDARYLQASSIAAFASLTGEPDTSALLQQTLDDQKELWLPKVVRSEPPTLAWIRVLDLEQLEPGTFGILEPSERPRVARGRVERFELIVVPGLAFGSDGSRLGFGGGYYDRALRPVRDNPEVTRMGLCFAAFFDPPEGPIPTGPRDVPMHCVVTEGGIAICGQSGLPAGD